MDDEVKALHDSLLAPRNITAFTQAVDTLKSRLSTQRFCDKLSLGSSEGESNGWTLLFKAIIVGLDQNRKFRKRATVDGLKALIDTADRRGAVLEVVAVDKFMVATAEQLTLHEVLVDTEDGDGSTILRSEIAADVAPMYLAVLSTLCGRSDYFRRSGAHHAQVVAEHLIMLCVSMTKINDELLQVDSASAAISATHADLRRNHTINTARPAAAAAKLLTRLVSRFPYALNQGSLAALFRHFDHFIEWSIDPRACYREEDGCNSQASRPVLSQPTGGHKSERLEASTSDPSVSVESTFDGNRRRDADAVQHVKALLPQLLSAINMALRRQAVDRVDFVWQQLISSDSVHVWIHDVLHNSDHLLLLHEVVQLCRMCLRLAKLRCCALPQGLLDAIMAMANREMSATTALRLVDLQEGSFIGRLLRGPLAGASAATEGWFALCALQLVADTVLLQESHVSVRGGDAAVSFPEEAPSPKRQRTQQTREHTGLWRWLMQHCFGHVDDHTLEFSSSIAPQQSPFVRSEWRSLLLLAVCLRRGLRLSASTCGSVMTRLVAVAAQCSEMQERAAAICAMLALLALIDTIADSRHSILLHELWRSLWAMEMSAIETEVARGSKGSVGPLSDSQALVCSANEAAMHADLRREVLSSLLRHSLVHTTVTAAAATEAIAIFFRAADKALHGTVLANFGEQSEVHKLQSITMIGWISQSRQALVWNLWARHPTVLEQSPRISLALALALHQSAPAAGVPLLSSWPLGLAPCSPLVFGDGDRATRVSRVWYHWLGLRARLLLVSVGLGADVRFCSIIDAHLPCQDGPDSGPPRNKTTQDVIAPRGEDQEAEWYFERIDDLIETVHAEVSLEQNPRTSRKTCQVSRYHSRVADALAPSNSGACFSTNAHGAISSSGLTPPSIEAEAALQEVSTHCVRSLRQDPPCLLIHMQAVCMGALVLVLSWREEVANHPAESESQQLLALTVFASTIRVLDRLSGSSDPQAVAGVPLLVRLLVACPGREVVEFVRSEVVSRVLEQIRISFSRNIVDAEADANPNDAFVDDFLDSNLADKVALEDVCCLWLKALSVLCGADNANGRVFDVSALCCESFANHGTTLSSLLHRPGLAEKLPGLCLRLVCLPHSALIAQQMELIAAMAAGDVYNLRVGQHSQCLDACEMLMHGKLAELQKAQRPSVRASKIDDVNHATKLLAGCSRVIIAALASFNACSLRFAAAAVRATVAWECLQRKGCLHYGASWQAAVQAANVQDVRPHVAREFPHLLDVQRRHNFGDSLLLQTFVLPHIFELGLSETLKIRVTESFHQPLEIHLSTIRHNAAILSRCSVARQRKVLFALCSEAIAMRPIEHVLLPVLYSSCAPAGGLHNLMELHLPWLVEQWLENSRCMLTFPTHWLHPSSSQPLGHSIAASCPEEPRRQLREMLERYSSIVVPSIIVCAAVAGVESRARHELERASNLLQRSERQMLQECLPHIIARWLPTKFLPPNNPMSLRWLVVEALAMDHLRNGMHGSGVATIESLIRQCMDHILQGLFSLDTATWLPHTPQSKIADVLLNSLRFLADQAEQGTLPADLLFATSGRMLELLLLLHYRHTSAARYGAPCELHRHSMIVLLELITSSEEVMPPLLGRDGRSLRHLNFVAMSRMIQHTALALLPLESGGTAGTGDVTLRRCCQVLKNVLQAVLGATTDLLSVHGLHYGEHREATAQLADFQRDHCTTLITSLSRHAEFSPDAADLLDFAISKLRPEALSMLPPLPPGERFAALASKCEHSRQHTPLAAIFGAFARLSEGEAAGADLSTRLQFLISKLEVTRADKELAQALPHATRNQGRPTAFSPTTSTPDVRQLADAAVRAAQRLIVLSRSTSSAEYQVLIARCLGALLRNGLPQRSMHADVPTVARTEGSIRSDVVDVVPKILLLLHGYLTDPDELAMLLAADALRQSLKTRSSELKVALNGLAREHLLVASELEAYVKPLPNRNNRREYYAPPYEAAVAAMSAADPLAPQSTCRSQANLALSDLNSTLPALWSVKGKTVDEWACSLAENLLRHSKHALLLHSRRLASRKPALARLCLLPAFLDLLEDKSDDDDFVASLARALSRSFDDALCTDPRPPPQERQAAELQLRLLLELRAHSMPRPTRPSWRFPSLWRTVDFSRAALAAQASGAPVTALQLLEIYAEDESELQPELILHAPGIATLLMDILSGLPAPDATLGMTALTLSHNAGTAQLLAARKDALDNLSLMDATRQVQLSHRGPTSRSSPEVENAFLSMVTTLRGMGCDHLYAAYTRRLDAKPQSLTFESLSMIEDSPAVREARAEAAWRLGLWDDETLDRSDVGNLTEDGVGLHESLYRALSSLQKGRANEASQVMKACACQLVAQLGQLGDEGGKRLEEVSSSLRLCTEVYEVASAGAQSGLTAAVATALDLTSFTSSEKISLVGEDGDQDAYTCMEPVLALHSTMLRCWTDAQSVADRAPLAHVLLQWVAYARRSNNYPMAAARLSELAGLKLSDEDRARAEWQHAQLLWEADVLSLHRDRKRAEAVAAVLLEQCKVSKPQFVHLGVDICSKLAVWKASERSISEKAFNDISKLHSHAVLMCEGLRVENPENTRSHVHHTFANFLEAQYRAILAEKNSPWEQRIEHMYTAMGTLCPSDAQTDSLLGQHDDRADAPRAILLNQLRARERWVKERGERILKLAQSAFDQHAASARLGETHNYASTFAMLSLWFAHPERLRSADETFRSIPSRQLLPLVPQLACRLGGASTPGARKLQLGLRSLLLHLGTEHVHQVLPHFLALALGDHFSPREREVIADPAQMQAALQLRDSIKQNLLRTSKASVVDDTHKLFMLYLQIAWVDVDTTREVVEKHRGRPAPLDKLMSVDLLTRYSTLSGRQLYETMQHRGEPSNAPMLTRDADTTCGHAECEVSVEGFSPPSRDGSRKRSMAEFSTAGGVNLPKIIQCFGSDGTVYKQLVKGRDDGRQDAALQEVFSLINALLHRDPETRRRALHLRTYRIVPLAPTAALLQWVDNSIPLMAYLTGTKGAHERYRPGDLKTADARRMMQEAHNREVKQQKGLHRAQAFEQVMDQLRPVLHFFFLERWPQPSAWFERRLTYTRSLAVSSMAGFIVGLGDRHSSNILLDNETAELIHIDLGIAFDQGSLLRIPECVPFRLTRDLVDGLGVCGVEGPMRGSAEHTMRVLRANAEALLAILQLVVHNPLYKWSQEEKQMQDRQLVENRSRHELSDYNPEAERALSRVQLKLEGREVGRHECLSVEGQVWQLIDQARDPANLSRMFEGWAAWL